MIGIILDAFALMFILWFLERGEDDFAKIFLVSLGLSVVNLVIFLGLAKEIGILSVGVALIMDALLIMWWCHMRLLKAILASFILMCVKIVYSIWLLKLTEV